MRLKFYIILSYLVLNINLTTVLSELRLINVLFRHGDRAPGNFIKTCPNDPYINNTFYPMGNGGLTNTGKLRTYNLGTHLRSIYNEFLGKVYLSEEVEAVSSDSPRARMSLQMVLAGLYPPTAIQQWDHNTNWQPVLTSFKPKSIDTIFVPQLCEEYDAEYNRILNSTEFQSQISQLEPFMENLTKAMGRRSLISTLDMNYLYHTLDSERALNLTLPDWADDIFPDGNLRKGAVLQYLLYGYNEKLRRLSGGVLLRKMIQDMKYAQNKLIMNNKKIYLYGGHELNIVMLLHSLRLYDDQIPEYSTSIIIELHEIQNEFYVKIWYYDGINRTMDVQIIPGCTELCPFNTFIKLLANEVPTETELKCKRIKK